MATISSRCHCELGRGRRARSRRAYTAPNFKTQRRTVSYGLCHGNPTSPAWAPLRPRTLCGDRCAPLFHGITSEDAQSATGDQVALDVEGVENGRMSGEESLSRTG